MVKRDSFPPLIDFSCFGNKIGELKDENIYRARKLVANQLDSALAEYGCFLATADFYSEHTKEAAFQEMRRFLREKERTRDPEQIQTAAGLGMGYNGYGTESTGKAYGNRHATVDPAHKFTTGGCGNLHTVEDVLEHFDLSEIPQDVGENNLLLKSVLEETPFPDVKIRNVLQSVLRMGDRMACVILRALAMALDVDQDCLGVNGDIIQGDLDYFVSMHKFNSVLRTIFCPETNRKWELPSERLTEHEDISSLTLLLTDDVEVGAETGGLQIKNPDGQWQFVTTHKKNAYFVNLGCTMVRLSNNKWKAVRHRVMWPDGSAGKTEEIIPERMSMPMFVSPTPGAVIAPVRTTCSSEKPLFKAQTIDEILLEKLNLLF